jgi:hypothetical protein
MTKNFWCCFHPGNLDDREKWSLTDSIIQGVSKLNGKTSGMDSSYGEMKKRA